jgi:hypothetical protein
VGIGGGGGAEAYEGEKAWSSINPSILYERNQCVQVRTRLYRVTREQQLAAGCSLQLMEKGTCSGKKNNFKSLIDFPEKNTVILVQIYISEVPLCRYVLLEKPSVEARHFSVSEWMNMLL